jgi:PAS domain S-box-containing protein
VTRTLEGRHKRLAEHAKALSDALDERRKAELRLDRAEQNYRNLVEQLPLFTYIDRLDATSSSIYASPQTEEMLGYTPLEWMSDADLFVKILHPGDRDRVLELHRRNYEAGESFVDDYRLIAKDGRTVWVHDEVMIAKDEEGRPVHAQGFMVDITRRKQAEAELERRHAELEALHETALMLVEELDTQKLLERIALRAGELIGTENTYVYLRDGEDDLRVHVGTGVFADKVGVRMHNREGLAGRVWTSGEPLVVDDYQAWHGRDRRYEGLPIHAVAGVPLPSRTEGAGVLGIAHTEVGRTFSESEIELLSRFAHLASLVLESAQLYEQARASEETYRALVSNVPGAIYRCAFDPSWTMELLSDSIEEISGWPAVDFLRDQKRTYASIIHPDDVALVEEAVGDGAPYSVEYRILHADGGVRWVFERGQAVTDARGNVWLDGAIFDITERKRAEAAVRESEAKFRSFVETTEEWVWAIDRNRTLTYSNPAVQRLLGWTADAMVGRDWIDFALDEDRKELDRTIEEYAGQKGGWTGLVVRWRHKDGSVRHLESTATPILDERGELTGWRGTDRDVTHRILVEAERGACSPQSRRRASSPRPRSATSRRRTRGCASSTG